MEGVLASIEGFTYNEEDVAPAAKAQSKTKKYRQATEAHGVVEVLCFSCRRSKERRVQSVLSYFAKGKSGGADEKIPVCARCRRPMQEKSQCSLPGQRKRSLTGELPQLKRLRAYRKVAQRQGTPFTISERAACALMRQSCTACGEPAPDEGHGLTRLRKWPEGMERSPKCFMGPYCDMNLATACTMCNMMKGHRTVRGLVEAARHIATQHTTEENFGEYPTRFRDNVSKRSRSGYITSSSTHTKTHSMTNDEFQRIVSEPCFYCRKMPRKPGTLGKDDRGHFNGLDRLESSNRVYRSDTVVACCGDCNMMKYRWPLDGFLDQCRKIARFNRDRTFSDEDVAEDADALDEVPDVIEISEDESGGEA